MKNNLKFIPSCLTNSSFEEYERKLYKQKIWELIFKECEWVGVRGV